MQGPGLVHVFWRGGGFHSAKGGEALACWRDKLSGCIKRKVSSKLFGYKTDTRVKQTVITDAAACESFRILLFKLSATSCADK
jgi:hypothetical protein